MTPTALVTDGARGSALAVVRGLGRAGWRVVVVDERADPPAAASRYCTASAVVPSPFDAREAFVDAVHSIAEAHEVDVVFPITDDAGHPLAEARSRFDPHVRLALPEPRSAAIVNDKARTLELARELGIAVPDTVVLGPGEMPTGDAHRLGWPVVVKPAVSRTLSPDGGVTKHTVTYAHDAAGLSSARREAGLDQTVLVQALCPGVGVGVEMLAHEGRPLLAFQHRRLAEVPVTGGASAIRESVALDPGLARSAAALVEALRFTGPIMVEFKVQGDDARLMEINGRIWGSLPLATRCGVDIPGAWGALFHGEPPSPDGALTTRYPIGVRTHEPRLLLAWTANVLLQRKRVRGVPSPGRWDGWRGLAAAIGPASTSDYVADDDPAPARAQRARQRREWLGRLGLGGSR